MEIKEKLTSYGIVGIVIHLFIGVNQMELIAELCNKLSENLEFYHNPGDENWILYKDYGEEDLGNHTVRLYIYYHSPTGKFIKVPIYFYEDIISPSLEESEEVNITTFQTSYHTFWDGENEA